MIKASDFDIGQIKNNILSYLDIATRQDIETGQQWYRAANDLAGQWSKQYGISKDRVIGLIAVFSIDKSWQHNKRDVKTYLQSNGNAIVGRYSMVRNKANGIYAGQDILPILGNAKIFCFYHNILLPDQKTRITIDRHAAAAAIKPGSNKVDWAYYNTPAKYRAIETAYNLAAQQTGQIGHIVQAIVWITHRRLYVGRIPGRSQEYRQE